MSGISSGIGLISGIDTANLIDQLMAIEARPVEDLRERVQAVDVQRTAFLGISAKILALKNTILQFDDLSFFRKFNSSSSNEGILTAEANARAVAGSYTFRVHSLATNHSVISRGFADADTTPVGVGTLAIEIGRGLVNKSTELSALNGGQGVHRGVITITDRSGAVAEIDLSKAITVDDVLDAINRNAVINVRASVTGMPANGASGDRIVIEDLTPEDAVTGNLIIADELDGAVAADLGIAANTAAARVDGSDLVRLSMSTRLALLNDGNGVGAGGVIRRDDLIFTKSGANPESFTVSLSDVLELDTDLRALNSGQGVRLGIIRITDRAGKSVDVDLTDLDPSTGVTMGDVRDRIMAVVDAAEVAVSITPVNSHLQITDSSGVAEEAAGNLIVEDVTGFAATDLGIAGEVNADSIQGEDIFRISSIGDVINAINYASGNNGRIVQAGISADGNGITLEAREFDTTVTVNAGENSTAARDLGILDARVGFYDPPFESRHLLAGLNTVLLQSLQGGTGINLGAVQFTDRLNQTTTIDFADPVGQPHTLQDVVDLINADSNVALVALINAAGNGLEIRDESGGTGQLVIRDLNDGTTAAELGIAGTFSPADTTLVNGGNLQLQYVSRQTQLAELNAGRGVTLGAFRITDSLGVIREVELAANLETVGEVIDAINRVTPDTIEARINDTGDGIIVVDSGGGSLPLTIEDLDGGQVAASLRLAGAAGEGENFLDGSFEIRIDLGPTDTLDDVARKLNEAGAGLSAAVLNDGGEVNPYGLTITSTESGRRGELIIDSSGLDLGFKTMSKAQDALVSTGGGSAGNALLISSSSNTLDGAIDGVTLNLLSVGDEDVTVTVGQDVEGITGQLSQFVEKYNDVQAAIDDAVRFDQDTLERGPLLGDSTIQLIRTRLHRVMAQRFEGADPSVSYLRSIGLSLGANRRLEFDEEKFLETYERSPELVEHLFTAEETGLGSILEETFDGLTRDFDGVIARKDDLLGDQQDLLNERIDRLNVLLDAKRLRLEAQFVSLESSLAVLQGQQDALASLAQLAGSMST